MTSKKNTYKYEDFWAVLQSKSWFALLFGVLHVSTFFSWFFGNFTKIRPNHITLFSLFLGFISSGFILSGHFFAGGLFFWLSYMFDCVDGSLARVTKRTSNIGAWLDIFCDHFKFSIYILSYYLFFRDSYFRFLILSYLILFDFTSIFWMAYQLSVSKLAEHSKITGVTYKNKIVNGISFFFRSRKIKPIWSAADVNMVVFFIYPVFFPNNFAIFFTIALIMILIHVLVELYYIVRNLY